MKTPWKKIFIAVAMASAVPASAIPVTFEFTGTVQSTWDSDFEAGTENHDAGPIGAAFSAQFTFDTDLFGPPESIESEYDHRITYSSQLSGAYASSLVINGTTINLTPFSTNTASVYFTDSRGWLEHEDGSREITPDSWGLSLRSEEITPLGRTRSNEFGFGFTADIDFEDPTGGPGLFDLSRGIDLDSIATVPMLGGFYNRPISIHQSDTFSCAERCQLSGSSGTLMVISSITRSATSVPEPGSLGLLAAGLAGAWFARRRQVGARVAVM